MINQPFLTKVQENLAEISLKITENTFPKIFSKERQIFVFLGESFFAIRKKKNLKKISRLTNPT